MYPEDARYFQPESHAERRLYPLFAELPDEYTVFAGRRWHTKGVRDRKPRSAEADFLVAHAERGILVVEVKGGVIRYEPATDRWFTNDNPLKRSPFAQVERTRYLLAEMLGQTGHRDVEWPLGEAVAFPDVRLRPGELPDGLLPGRVIDADDLDHLGDAVERAFETFAMGDRAQGFGRRGVKALTDAVAGSVAIRRHLGHVVAEAEAEIIRLTENQYEVLESLDGNQRVCVLGGAGTGKTLLAVEQARRLAAQGHRVLLTCFNAPLAGHLRRAVGTTEGITVFHFHRLCFSWAEEAGLDAAVPDNAEQKGSFYEYRLPGLLADAATHLGREFDAVLVDEAQDFRAPWLDALQLLLADEDDSVLFLFADENQAIYRDEFSVPDGFIPYRLTGNLRNTTAIHGLLARHFGERSKPKGPAGVDVTTRWYRDDRDLAHQLSSLMTSLTEHGVKPSQVTVLSGHSTDRSALARHQKEPLGIFRLSGSPNRQNDVRFESVHRFKGLEAPVIILCEMDHLHPSTRKRLWYTGISRANGGLFLLLRDTHGDLDGCDLDAAIDALLTG